MQFEYTLDFVTDGHYGAYDPVTKKWNGLVGQLVDKVKQRTAVYQDVIMRSLVRSLARS